MGSILSVYNNALASRNCTISHSDTAAHIEELVNRAILKNVASGVVGMFACSDGVLYEGAFGTLEIGSPEVMTLDTVFWLASMTKLVTTVAAMQLVESQCLSIDEPVAELLPELAKPVVLQGFDSQGSPIFREALSAITMRQLLTHTAGIGYEIMNPELLRARGSEGPPAATSLSSLLGPLACDPGTGWEYGYGIDWAGLAVERVTGQRLDKYLADHVFSPLRMKQTGFGNKLDIELRRATTHQRQSDGNLLPIPSPSGNDEDWEFHSGGAGLSGTAGDYIRLLRMLLNDGILDGERVLESKTVDAMWRIQSLDVPAGRLRSAVPQVCYPYDPLPGQHGQWCMLGVVNPQDIVKGRRAGSAAWAGIAGTSFWLDRRANLCGVTMAQLLPFADPALLEVQRSFERAAYADLFLERT